MKVRYSARDGVFPQIGPAVKHRLSNRVFPIGNTPREAYEVVVTTSGGPRIHRFAPENSKCNVLFAQPHPYMDVSRLQPNYEREPTWLFYVRELLSSRALAVILTYPPDVPKLKTHFLRPLDFLEPYHVLAVNERQGTQADHSQVLLLGRRGEGLANVNLSLDPLPLRTPLNVARRIAPTASRALLALCGVERITLEKELRDSRFDVFRASNSWTPWED